MRSVKMVLFPRGSLALVDLLVVLAERLCTAQLVV